MQHKKFVILGAGPSGLSVAHALLNKGLPRSDLVVLEKEEEPGGLCRSKEIDGAPLDIGGGHFLDNRKTQVLEFLFRFMPIHEWNRFDRISKIRIRDREVDHPLESNLWQLPQKDQLDFLESIAQAGCVQRRPRPEQFSEWISWKLGTRIADEYMLPYNRKIWSIDLDRLGTYWLHKLPDVSFRETLQSCLERGPFGKLPAHGVFYYPKSHGYGEVWRRMGEALGESLKLKNPVTSIDLENLVVDKEWKAGFIISSIPWTLWPQFCSVPDSIRRSMSKLENAAIDVDYAPDAIPSPAHWIYEPSESIRYHRILLRQNFAPGSNGYWTETNASRSGEPRGWRYRNQFAYPINTTEKPRAIENILYWAKSRRILGIGRWGRWEHMNSDVAVGEALAVANSLYEEAVD
jgi:protoporphyrinogen oxidase